jgi:hypothetical protein
MIFCYIYLFLSMFLVFSFFPDPGGCVSDAAWRLHYYQWAMQIFEQYNISEGAYQFALAALEQVDEALSPNDHYSGRDPLSESSATIKGRLWANVFKFTLDLNRFYDAYCAIITNPDEESKYICLRRFIIVLYECGAMKVLYEIIKFPLLSLLLYPIIFFLVLKKLQSIEIERESLI